MSTTTVGTTEDQSGKAVRLGSYVWRARAADGKIVHGSVKATSAEDIYAELLRQGYIPLKVTGGAAGAAGGASQFTLRRRAKSRPLLLAVRQLASMVKADIPDLEAFEIVAEECEDPVLKEAFEQIVNSIRAGSGVADAIAAQGNTFPPLVVDLVGTGAASGRTPEMLERAATLLDERDTLRLKVIKSLVYPAILLFVGVASAAGMSVFFVPKIQSTFTSVGGTNYRLPFLTRMVVDISHLVPYAAAIFAALFIAGGIYIRSNRGKPHVRSFTDGFLRRTPLVKHIYIKAALQRYTATLAIMLSSGIDRMVSLERAAVGCGSYRLEQAGLAVRDAVGSGAPISEAMRAQGDIFPKTLISPTHSAEKSGDLPNQLNAAAAMFNRDVTLATDSIADSMTPILTSVIGLVIGVIVIALYLPIMSLGNVLGGGMGS